MQDRFTDIHLLAGAGVDILEDGSLDYPDEILDHLWFNNGSTDGHKRPFKEAVLMRRKCYRILSSKIGRKKFAPRHAAR